ncbi:hypothetical protein GCM10023350_08580 [Nocardioides endophyticus]|uniref:ATP-binding protein n=1 Tax=Nocardioides endophyticus TaxID=1353775 RepID=A0ABP8YEE9_9ACTN
MTSTTGRDLKAGIERFRLGDRPDVAVLYPDVCFASLEAVGEMPVDLLIDSVLTGWQPEDHLTAPAGADARAPFPVASLVVSRDSHDDFHPELSNREPVEIQVWADGRVTLEIEFQGVDVTAVPGAWAHTVRRVLDAWAGSYGVVLTDVFNDRARSLPDVWNAAFEVADQGAVVADLVELGERALRTAELSMSGWGGERAVRELLAQRDTHSVLGWQPSAVLELWPAPPEPEEVELFVADLCALANSVRGGAVVVGVGRGEDGATLEPFLPGHLEDDVRAWLAERIYPPPDRVVVQHVVGSGLEGDLRGILVVSIPPQDDLLRPFLVHDNRRPGVVDGNTVHSVALVEREGTETVSRSVAAVHAALAAGTALLRRADRG